MAPELSSALGGGSRYPGTEFRRGEESDSPGTEFRPDRAVLCLPDKEKPEPSSTPVGKAVTPELSSSWGEKAIALELSSTPVGKANSPGTEFHLL